MSPLNSGVFWFILTTISQNIVLAGLDVRLSGEEPCSVQSLIDKAQHLPSYKQYDFIYKKCQIYAYPKQLQKHLKSTRRMRSIQSSLLSGSECEAEHSHWNSTIGGCVCNPTYFMEDDSTCGPCVPCCPDDVQVIHSCQQQGLDTDICREVQACTTGTDITSSWASVIIAIGSALLGFLILLILIVCLVLHRERLQIRWRRLRDNNEIMENGTRQQTDPISEQTSPDLANFMPPTMDMSDPNDSRV